jgi:hypothetical protein
MGVDVGGCVVDVGLLAGAGSSWRVDTRTGRMSDLREDGKVNKALEQAVPPNSSNSMDLSFVIVKRVRETVF